MQKLRLTAAPGMTCFREPLGVRFVSFYALADGERSTVFDAGIPGSVIHWIDEGHLKTPINRLIISHADADHIGDAANIKARFPQAQILCHADDREWIEKHGTLVQERYAFSHQRYGVGYPPDVLDAMAELCGDDVTVDATLSDGERLAIGDRTWEVLHVAGHSPGHISLWSAEDGILLLGDAVLGFGPPHVETGRPSMPATHQYIAPYLETIERLDRLPVKLALAAHWDFMDGEAFKAFLEQSRQRVQQDIDAVLEACKVEPQSFGDLLKVVNDRFREWDPAEDMSYIFALDGTVQYLLDAGKLREAEGRFHVN